jgi:hypothetical protein
VKPYQTALVVLLVSATVATPGAAQRAPSTPQALPNETCAGCFAYLEFSPSLEPESYATRGQATEPSTSLPGAGEPYGRTREQTAGLVVTSKQ